jgi:pantetheine-phosphate adenylyltransferase
MRVAVYPGSFDPMTNGHIDVLERAVDLFDHVFVTVARNASKKPIFTTEQRVDLIREAVSHLPQVDVDTFEGLIVDYAKQKGAVALIRGLRAVSDFEYEFQIALMNRKLAENITTVFLMPNEKYTYLNSSIVRELARLHTDVSDFVPPNISRALKALFST